MTLVTAVLAGVAFVLLPFAAIATIFLMGVAIRNLWRAGGSALHWAQSHHHHAV
jgi:hypothetical protein